MDISVPNTHGYICTHVYCTRMDMYALLISWSLVVAVGCKSHSTCMHACTIMVHYLYYTRRIWPDMYPPPHMNVRKANSMHNYGAPLIMILSSTVVGSNSPTVVVGCNSPSTCMHACISMVHYWIIVNWIIVIVYACMHAYTHVVIVSVIVHAIYTLYYTIHSLLHTTLFTTHYTLYYTLHSLLHTTLLSTCMDAYIHVCNSNSVNV